MMRDSDTETKKPRNFQVVLAAAALMAASTSEDVPTRADRTMTTKELDPDKYPAVLEQLDEADGGGWLASYPDLPGCFGHGATQADALRDGSGAIVLWSKAHAERNIPIPEPKANAESSGNIRVRVPRMLHMHLHVFAAAISMSLNALAGMILREEMDLLLEPNGGTEKKRNAMALQLNATVGRFAQNNKAEDANALLNWSYSDHDRFAGEWVQRIDPQLHHHLRFRADEQGVSINALITTLLSLGVGRREGAIMLNADGNGSDDRGSDCQVDDKRSPQGPLTGSAKKSFRRAA